MWLFYGIELRVAAFYTLSAYGAFILEYKSGSFEFRKVLIKWLDYGDSSSVAFN